MRWYLPPLLCVIVISSALSSDCRAQHTTLDLASFGAIPDDGVDDIAAINAAIQVIGSGNVQLVFQPGVYDLRPRSHWSPSPAGWPSWSIFYIQNASNVTIQGNGGHAALP
jgi:hypothetical protein